jgi:Na+/phosphate symporter
MNKMTGEGRREIMAEARALQEQLELFRDVAANLVMMIETARSAFNRQDRHDLEKLARCQTIAKEEIGLASSRIDAHLSRTHREGRVPLIRLSSILSHLEMIVEGISEMLLVLEKQIRDGIPFSRKGIDQANELFDGQIEILRALEDIFQTDNEVLKKWICHNRGPELSRSCIDFATAHESRLVEGLCLPHAAPVFLTLLDVVRTLTRHEMEVARLLMQEHRRATAAR